MDLTDDSLLLVMKTADGLSAQVGYTRRSEIRPYFYRAVTRPIELDFRDSPLKLSNYTRCYVLDREYSGVVFYKERLDS